MSPLLRAALLAALCAACRCTPEAPAPPKAPVDLLAAVEEKDTVRVLQRRTDGTWETFRELPAQARALRFSRDGRHVAWMLDLMKGDQPVVVGYLWRDGDEKPVKLGVLGFGVHHASAWDVGDGGRVAYIDESGALAIRAPDGKVKVLGRGSDAVFGAGELVAYRLHGESCIVVPEGLPCLSGSLARPFAFAGQTLWAQSEQRIAIGAEGREEYHPVLEPLAVRPRDDGRALVLRRDQLESRTVDELALFDKGMTRELLEAPIILAFDWTASGRVLVVRSERRGSLYDLLLAHTPDAFGGESGAGEALELDPVEAKPTAIRGLENRRVRVVRTIPPPDVRRVTANTLR